MQKSYKGKTFIFRLPVIFIFTRYEQGGYRGATTPKNTFGGNELEFCLGCARDVDGGVPGACAGGSAHLRWYYSVFFWWP